MVVGAHERGHVEDVHRARRDEVREHGSARHPDERQHRQKQERACEVEAPSGEKRASLVLMMRFHVVWSTAEPSASSVASSMPVVPDQS